MAEFQEVMRQLNRMCSYYPNCGDSGCPLFDKCGNVGSYSSNAKRAMQIEKTVMSLVTKHPEPVYPTWIDWLMSEGVIPTNYMAANSTDSGVRAGTFYVTSKAFEHIPADIAQKLGIEPKENV